MKVRVENETLIFEEDSKFDWNFIGTQLLNAVEYEEFLYWKSIEEQAEEYGLEFAEETYLEDLNNCGGELRFEIHN